MNVKGQLLVMRGFRGPNNQLTEDFNRRRAVSYLGVQLLRNLNLLTPKISLDKRPSVQMEAKILENEPNASN